jgi:PKD domain
VPTQATVTTNAPSEPVPRVPDAPVASAGDGYLGRIGEPITFDASASEAVAAEIVSYSWDFTGDGTFDRTTTEPMVTEVLEQLFKGSVVVWVTDRSGRQSEATAILNVTRDGDLIPDEIDNCPDDPEPSSDSDGDGLGDVCDPTTPLLEDKPGIVATSSDVRFAEASVALTDTTAILTVQSSVPADQSGTIGIRVVGQDNKSTTGTFVLPIKILADNTQTSFELPSGWQRGPGDYRFEIVYTETDGRTEVPDNDPRVTIK